MNKQTDIPQHAAIMGVIEAETDSFARRDFDAWADCWVQDSRTREVCFSPSFGVTVVEGWDNLSAYIKDVLSKGSGCQIDDFRRENVQISQSSDTAHVVFNGRSHQSDGRIEETFETRILERQRDGWRIVYASFALRGHQITDANRLAVDAEGRVVSASAATLNMLKKHPGLQISQGRLRASKPAWDKKLQQGLASASELHGYFQQQRFASLNGHHFRLPVVLGEDDGGVIVCTLFVRDDMTFVEIQDDETQSDRMIVARAIYGLSDGQMALAQQIVRGESLTTAAGQLGISVNTARTHLSRIYAKTGVNSQTALVRTLLSVG